eukprot:CAMPEP_0114395106 /NCGR_PEP_ID=MMETSP0102-20121206/12654_1 /TAXON_ID=38822 ORGANISM="Pteridomonas danica, Strain PT" /NCGR_SAMPLE_ID=MMETSP0102 /ASSEMBLY_ACC=CAM_ASM_000212 /LENGTH=171 /DNA_ID=CAMNT_0001555329 /DNA_START=11 /DNA_END=526 /DNA_ORIENTATION=-
MDGWSSDEEFFRGGLSLEDLAAENSKKLVLMFEAADSKLFNNQQIENEDIEPPVPNQDHLYGYFPPPPPKPCHVEWGVFTNLRVDGIGISKPSELNTKIENEEDVIEETEEIFAIDTGNDDISSIQNKQEIPMVEKVVSVEESTSGLMNEEKKLLTAQIWNQFMIECFEVV